MPRLKNQQPESTYLSGIILRKELGLFSVPHFVYHYHYLLQIASKNENSAKRCFPPLKDLYQVFTLPSMSLRSFAQTHRSTPTSGRFFLVQNELRTMWFGGSTEHFCNFAKVSHFKGLVLSCVNGQKSRKLEFLHIVATILKISLT